MSKKNIMLICVAIAIIIAIVIIIWFASSSKNEESITLTIYDENFDTEKVIQIKNKKQIKELKNIFNNCSLEQDETTPYLAIKNDIKVEVEKDKFFIIQLDLDEYCYYENNETNTALTIKMPDRLFQIVNDNINKNSNG